METVKIFAMLNRFGLETFLAAGAVLAVYAAIRKLFPRLPERTETAIKLALSFLAFAVYLAATGGDFGTLPERGTTVFGLSFAIGNVFCRGAKKDATEELIKTFVPEDKLPSALSAVRECKTEEQTAGVLAEYSENMSDSEIKAMAKIITRLNGEEF